MRYVGFFTPQANPTGTFDLTVTQGRAMFSNESCNNLQVTLSDGQSFKLPAGVQRLICLKQQGTLIKYQTLTALNIPCIDAVDVEVYDPSDQILEQYPSAMVRQAIVGNSLNLSTSVTNLVNDGNVAGTQIIEAKVSGDVSSAVTLTNDAIFVLGDAAHNGSLTVFGPTSLDNGTITTNGLGTATFVEVDTNTIKSPADGASVFGVSAGKTRVQNSAIIAFQIPAGTDRANITSTAFQLLGTTVFKGLTGDSIARFGSASGTGSGTFNHTLGATPDFAAITTHAGGGTQTVGYDSENSTQFHVDTGAGLAWFALLTKRT